MFLACRRGNQPDFAHITFDWEGTINRLPCEHITSFLSHGKNKEKSLSITIQRSTRINEIQHKHMQYGVHMDQKQMQSEDLMSESTLSYCLRAEAEPTHTRMHLPTPAAHPDHSGKQRVSSTPSTCSSVSSYSE
eukprot:scaffold224_cov108-Skeletonema_marinoi.AAC.19